MYIYLGSVPQKLLFDLGQPVAGKTRTGERESQFVLFPNQYNTVQYSTDMCSIISLKKFGYNVPFLLLFTNHNLDKRHKNQRTIKRFSKTRIIKSERCVVCQ